MADSDSPSSSLSAWATLPETPWNGAMRSLPPALQLGAQLDALSRLSRTKDNPRGLSLRALLAARELSVSFSTAWRALSIYKLCQEYPEVAHCMHLGVGHLSVLLGAPRSTRRTLIQRAESERWSRRRVETQVRALKKHSATQPKD